MSSRLSPTMCMQILPFLFTPCHDYHPAILPLITCGLDLPSSTVLGAVADPDALGVRGRRTGEMSCLEGA